MSRHFPIKCIFLGVVGQPFPYRGFYGSILLERVSEEVGVSRLKSYTNFSDNVLINWAIKNGDWRQLINDDSVTSNVIVEIVSVSYGLDGAVADQLETYFTTFSLRQFE